MTQEPVRLIFDNAQVAYGEELQDERKSHRARAVLRVVKIQTADDEGLARLQNISDDGMKLRVSIPVYLGDTVIVHLSEIESVSAKVIWTQGENCGVQLASTIDSGALLLEMAERNRDGSMRALRLPANARGVAQTDNGTHSIQVKDVSQRGMKVQHRSAFVEGLPVKILLQSGLERRGLVRWSNGDVAGIQFIEPMSIEDLGSSKKLGQ